MRKWVGNPNGHPEGSKTHTGRSPRQYFEMTLYWEPSFISSLELWMVHWLNATDSQGSGNLRLPFQPNPCKTTGEPAFHTLHSVCSSAESKISMVSCVVGNCGISRPLALQSQSTQCSANQASPPVLSRESLFSETLQQETGQEVSRWSGSCEEVTKQEHFVSAPQILSFS